MFASPAEFALIGLHEAENEQEKQEWLVELVELTGQDFGLDVARWTGWLKVHPWGKPEFDPKTTEHFHLLEPSESPEAAGGKQA